MKVKQLGNNGGLGDPTQTNSSFLIDLHDDHSEYLLFDCGYNIMARLVKEEQDDPYFEIAKIKYLVISHKHDDHCGNLETLIYWNHFKNNVQMDIFVACEGLAGTVKDTREIVDDFKIIEAQTYGELSVVNDGYFTAIPTKPGEAFSLLFVKAYHGAKPAVGVLISCDKRSIFISGDTKAFEDIEEFVDNHYREVDLIFHDYSNWDDESKNVHACKTDYEREYSQKFKDKAIKYHTASPDFNQEWQ